MFSTGAAMPSGGAGTPGQRKILTIRPLRIKPAVPEDFFPSNWASLASALACVRTGAAFTGSLEDLYRSVENLCHLGKSVQLFEKISAEIDVFVQWHFSHHISPSASAGETRILLQLASSWKQFLTQLRTISTIFTTLDRGYVKKETRHRSLFDFGLARYRAGIAEPVLDLSLSAFLSCLRRDRLGELNAHEEIVATEAVCSMWIDLGMYSACGISAAVLGQSAKFYAEEASKWLFQSEIPSYLVHVETCLAQEAGTRSSRFCDPPTGKELVKAVELAFIGNHAAEILDKGFDAMLREFRIRLADLERLYVLFSKHEGAVELIRKSFIVFLKRAGAEILHSSHHAQPPASTPAATTATATATATAAAMSDAPAAAPSNVIERLLDLHTMAEEIIRTSWRGDANFNYGVSEAFEYVLNSSGGPVGSSSSGLVAAPATGQSSKPAAALAKFLDATLRSNFSSEDELERLVDRCMVLFRALHAKDIFEAFYKSDLAKRLLLGRSASVDAERMMLGKLKAECGAQFTARLEGMFKDCELSKDLNARFKESKHFAQFRWTFDLYVNVLTTTHWPIPGSTTAAAAAGGGDGGGGGGGGERQKQKQQQQQKQQSGQTADPSLAGLPRELVAPLEVFRKFYSEQQRDNRRLTFQFTYSTCVLKATFAKGAKELQLSLHQALVLLQAFNASVNSASSSSSSASAGGRQEEEFLSLKEIKERVKIFGGEDATAGKELKLALQALCHPKTRILLSSPTPTGSGSASSGAEGGALYYRVNTDFSSPQFRVKIMTVIQSKDASQEEAKQTEERVLEDRQYQIDAAIVRIMKARKTLSHQDLLASVFEQLRFTMRAADMKKRIESLIEREYLERDAKNAQVYHYMA